VVALLDRDPQMGTDRLAQRSSTFPPASNLHLRHAVDRIRECIFWNARRIEWKFLNAPNERPRASLSTRPAILPSTHRTETFPPDQYTLQETHSPAVFENARFRFRLKIHRQHGCH